LAEIPPIKQKKEPQRQQAVTAHLAGTLLGTYGTHDGQQTVTVHIHHGTKILINHLPETSQKSSGLLLRAISAQLRDWLLPMLMNSQVMVG